MRVRANENVAARPGRHVAMRTWPWTLAGLIAVATIFGGVGTWGATVPLASAVIAAGQITVDTNRKQIEHLEGGIVAELRVRDGDRVPAGAVLIRLDATRARASLAIAKSAYREGLAKAARYMAERDGKDAIDWPADLLEDADDPAVAELLPSQQAIFDSRRETLRGEIDILRERIKQLRDQIEGLAAEKGAVERQAALIEGELEPLIDLLDRGHTTQMRVGELQREAARLDGERGALAADIAVARKSIAETELEILQKQKAYRNEVVGTLRDVQSGVNELRERFIAAQDVLRRIDIRAPVSGTIVGLTVHGEDAVVEPGETVLEIVPADDRLLVEVRVQPQDIDNVAIGQSSDVRFLAFKQRTTPTVEGMVSYVSADALTNPQDGSAHYLARIEVAEAELERLQGLELQPGMPAEVMIRTGERTAMAYMLQPILDSMNRAWREE